MTQFNHHGRLKTPLRWTSALALYCLVGLAQAAPFAHVVNRYDNNVSVVDLASNTVVGAIPAGMATPQKIKISPDGTRAYLSSIWSNTVSVLDLDKRSLLASIPLNYVGNDVVLSPAGDLAYADINTPSGAMIVVIDTVTNQVIRTFSIGQRNTNGIAISPDGARIYSLELQNDPGVGSVAVIDTASSTVVEYIGVGTESADIKISPSGTFIYVVNRDSLNPNGTVTVIDTRTNTVSATVAVGQIPVGVAFNPSGTHAYVTNSDEGTVSVIDTTSHTVVGLIAVGEGPQQVAFNPSGSRAYVSNQRANTMSIIDTATQSVLTTVPVGSDPWGLSLEGNPLAPVVRITSAPTINPGNQAQYAIAGSCTTDAGDVRIQISDSNQVIEPVAAACSPSGQWSISKLAVNGLANGPISISATQTDNQGQTGVSQITTSKEAIDSIEGGARPGVVQAVPVSGVWAGLLLLVAGIGALHRQGRKLKG